MAVSLKENKRTCSKNLNSEEGLWDRGQKRGVLECEDLAEEGRKFQTQQVVVQGKNFPIEQLIQFRSQLQLMPTTFVFYKKSSISQILSFELEINNKTRTNPSITSLQRQRCKNLKKLLPS
jgi:hypothetical protein